MSYGDAFILVKWIDQWKESGKIRRAKKLVALQKDLEGVNEDIKTFRNTKCTNFPLLESLLSHKRMLEKKIQSFAH